MERIVAAVLLFIVIFFSPDPRSLSPDICYAAPTRTTNIGLYKPAYDDPRWDVFINSNSELLDAAVVRSPATVSDGEIALYSSSSKLLKRSNTFTGLAKITAGVLAAAVAGTDYAPPTSGTGILKGNGSGGFTTATPGIDYLTTSGDSGATGEWITSTAAWSYVSSSATYKSSHIRANAEVAGLSPLVSGGDRLRTTYEQAYTNDPSAGSHIVLNVADTSPYPAWTFVIVSSSAGSEITYVESFVTNTSITVASLALNHTTVTPKITCQQYFLVTQYGTYSGGYQDLTLYSGTMALLNTRAPTKVEYSKYTNKRSLDSWMFEITNGASQVTLTPTAGTWYNTGGIYIDVPPGVWRIGYKAFVVGTSTTPVSVTLSATLSTANNSESNPQLTSRAACYLNGGFGQTLHDEELINVTSNTVYYLNIKSDTSGLGSIHIDGDQCTTKIYLQTLYW